MRETTAPTPKQPLESLSRYWLITHEAGGTGFEGTGALTAGFGRTLPVFRFREEAEMYLHFRREREGLSPTEIGAAELLVILLESLKYVEWILLDPLPETLHVTTPLALSRKGFTNLVMDRREKYCKAHNEEDPVAG